MTFLLKIQEGKNNKIFSVLKQASGSWTYQIGFNTKQSWLKRWAQK